MKTVSARQANQAFSELLSQVERGEEVIILKHGHPVAVLSPYCSTVITPERQQAIDHAIEVMSKGLPWGRRAGRFRRDQMHER
jgi:prevent-host-death family protein